MIITKPGHTLGVAYLITREQFEHVACQENGGKRPEETKNWYNTIVSLGKLDGHEIVTITNNKTRKFNAPSEAYLNTLKRGLQENYPDMTGEDIDKYLQSCIRED